MLFGWTPFRVLTLSARQRATLDGWLAGERVSGPADSVLARADDLVEELRRAVDAAVSSGRRRTP